MTIRHVSLGVAVRIAHMSRRTMIGAGVLTGAAVVALAHVVGADVRGLTGGQPGLLIGLLPDGSREELQP